MPDDSWKPAPASALVTGGTGFIGSHLVDRLVADGHRVRCLVRTTSNLRWLAHHDSVELVYGELLKPESLVPAVEGIDTIFHLAGITAGRRSTLFSNNAGGTHHLLRAAVDSGTPLRRFVYLSTLAAAGPSHRDVPLKETAPSRPVTDYGHSKLKGEWFIQEVARNYSLPWSILRVPIIFGPRDEGVRPIFQVIRKGVAPKIPGPDLQLSILYVGDLIEGLVKAAFHPRAVGRLYYLSHPRIFSFSELVGLIAQAVDRHPIPIPAPFFMLRLAARMTELVGYLRGVSLPLTDRIKTLEERHWICDPARAEEELGWTPKVPPESAVKRTADWYQEQGWLT